MDTGQYCWGTQQMLEVIKSAVVDSFVFHQIKALVHPAGNAVQLQQCKTLNFLSPEQSRA